MENNIGGAIIKKCTKRSFGISTSKVNTIYRYGNCLGSEDLLSNRKYPCFSIFAGGMCFEAKNAKLLRTLPDTEKKRKR